MREDSALKRVLFDKSIISVFILVGLWNWLATGEAIERISRGKGLWPETIADLRQVNLHLQLHFYQILSSWSQIPFSPQRVTIVYIDDKTHWTSLWGDEPTDRNYLAELIKNASQPPNQAAVIALDVELLTPGKHPAGVDEPRRAAENRKLLNEINAASERGVPIVLPTSFVQDNDQKIRLPNIYDDSALPLNESDGTCKHAACAVFGFINAPEDRRRLPLQEKIVDWDKSGSRVFQSFALAAVAAWEGRNQLTQRYPLVAEALQKGSPIVGNFVSEVSFPKISVEDLHAGNQDAEASCRNRILLIGGRWHGNQGYGSLVDGHLGPVGVLPGVVFHANYIESLFSQAVGKDVGVRTGIALDLAIGLACYLAFELWKGWRRVGVIILTFLIAPVVAYIFLVTKNLYLDFLLPSELYFLHLLYEYARGRSSTRHGN